MDQLLTLFVFLFGLAIGSFLNVVISRLPLKRQSIVYPPSQCPQCSSAILWYDNIPLLSYLLLGGKCRSCRQTISFQYPFVEISMGILALSLVKRFGLTPDFVYYFAFTAALLVIIFIDSYHQIIPDLLSLPGILIGFAGSFAVESVSWQNSGLGILIGGGILYSIALIYYVLTGKDGMGGGDIKLLAMIGGFLGWQSLLFVVFASSLIGSLFGLFSMIIRKSGTKAKIPFGPFLSSAALGYLFFKHEILRLWLMYLHL